jgi:hypothetical protein
MPSKKEYVQFFSKTVDRPSLTETFHLWNTEYDYQFPEKEEKLSVLGRAGEVKIIGLDKNYEEIIEKVVVGKKTKNRFLRVNQVFRIKGKSEILIMHGEKTMACIEKDINQAPIPVYTIPSDKKGKLVEVNISSMSREGIISLGYKRKDFELFFPLHFFPLNTTSTVAHPIELESGTDLRICINKIMFNRQIFFQGTIELESGKKEKRNSPIC